MVKKLDKSSAEYLDKIDKMDFKYRNSERGFIVGKIGNIFKPSRNKDRYKKWQAMCERKDIWCKLMNYIEMMKEKVPGSNGRICVYCKKPWTYITRRNYRGSGNASKRPSYFKRNDFSTRKNFSVDRYDTNKHYTIDNITFCCLECNDRKGNSTFNDWKNFTEAKDLINET